MITAWLAKKGIGAALGALKWKLIAAAAALMVTYIGVLHMRLNWAQAGEQKALAAVLVAESANFSNMVTIGQLREANQSFADAQRLNDDAAKRMKERAEQSQREADKARTELRRLQELDRRAPDCATLLNRSLAACPALVRRLWPDTDRPN